MDDLLKLAFEHFHAEMDVILGAPAAFFAAVLVIAVSQYFVIKALQSERFEAQSARIEFLTRRLADSKSKLAERPAEHDLSQDGGSPSVVSARPQGHEKRPETQGAETKAFGREFADSRAKPRDPAVEPLVEKTVSGTGEWPSIASLSPRRLDADAGGELPPKELGELQSNPPEPAARLQRERAEIARPAQAPVEFESQPSGLPVRDDSPQSDVPAGANIPAPRLEVGILNLHEGSRVRSVVELEVLCAIQPQRLQAWVFSTRDRKWYPQEPFWRNRGILIATCHFGDEQNQPGETFRVSIIETEKALTGPIAVLPRDLPQTKALTVYRA
jgi:hypothetical protein